MSIIEKAVNKIGRPDSATKKRAKSTHPESYDDAEKYSVSKVEPPRSKAPTDQSKVSADQDSPENSPARPVVELPFSKLSDLGMLDPTTSGSPVAQEYRIIKRPLLQNIEGKGASSIKHANLIMVTSAVAGEGKTFSAINLAISIAMEKDKTVLFVDADVSKASAARVLEIPNDKGLIDLLHDDCKDFREVVMRSSYP